jgi:hypothetical protein
MTNQVISLLHLLEVALHTNRDTNELTTRVPILPPFAPVYRDWPAGFVHFGDVFDVPRLSSALGIEILEWRDLKLLSKEAMAERSTVNLPNNPAYGMEMLDSYFEKDELGCWSIIMTQFADRAPRPGVGRSTWPWHGDVPSAVGIDVAWTAVPSESVFTTIQKTGTLVVDLEFLGQLGDEKTGEGFIEKGLTTYSENSQNQMRPEDQLLCFDFLYYTAFKKVGGHFKI